MNVTDADLSFSDDSCAELPVINPSRFKRRTLSKQQALAIIQKAATLVEATRGQQHQTSLVDAFLQEYGCINSTTKPKQSLNL